MLSGIQAFDWPLILPKNQALECGWGYAYGRFTILARDMARGGALMLTQENKLAFVASSDNHLSTTITNHRATQIVTLPVVLRLCLRIVFL
jgi:hypothetical protein